MAEESPPTLDYSAAKVPCRDRRWIALVVGNSVASGLHILGFYQTLVSSELTFPPAHPVVHVLQSPTTWVPAVVSGLSLGFWYRYRRGVSWGIAAWTMLLFAFSLYTLISEFAHAFRRYEAWQSALRGGTIS